MLKTEVNAQFGKIQRSNNCSRCAVSRIADGTRNERSRQRNLIEYI